VAGVAQTHIYHRFAWQAWHKLTSTVVLRGRRGTNSQMAGVAQMAAQTHIYLRSSGSDIYLRSSGSDMFSASFRLFFWLVYVCHVPACIMAFRHVLWSLWHVLFSDMLPASLRLFCWLVYACPVWSLQHVVFTDMFSCLP